MATIMCLPDEMIAMILNYNNLSTKDIVNFKCMWEQFCSTAEYDIDWERIFSQRWPFTKKLYDKQSKENEQKDFEENEQKDKKSLNFIETGINCERQLRDYVSRIIDKHFHILFIDIVDNDDHKIIDNYLNLEYVLHLDKHFKNNIDEIIYKPENSIKYSFFIDEMKNLLTQSPRQTGCDLTVRYYNLKLFHYMRQCSVKKKWDEYKKKPPKEQLLEQSATFRAQWLQPLKDVFYSCVKASLDNIALEVLNYLREKHPDHSIFSTSADIFSYCKNNNIYDNYWNEAEGMQIMDTLEEYIFGKLNFQPSEISTSIDTNVKNMCIDNVLKNKHGHEAILFIIYHSVARRLGLRCDVIKLDHFICIYWEPEYATDSLENLRCFSINFNKFPDCLVNQVSLYRTLYLRNSTGHYTYNIKAVSECHALSKLSVNSIIQYNQPCMYRYDYSYQRSCKLSLGFNKTASFIRRSEDVKFAVGMIVTHRDQHAQLLTYANCHRKFCTGVIIGWHRDIDTHLSLSSSDAYTQLWELPIHHCISNFDFPNQQTKYIILTENNKMCYVEEDAITLTMPKWIDNSEIGRYFCRFKGTHYIPNPMLAKLYPQDAAIIAETSVFLSCLLPLHLNLKPIWFLDLDEMIEEMLQQVVELAHQVVKRKIN